MKRVALVVCAFALSLLVAQPMARQGKKPGGNRGTATPVSLSVTIEASDSYGQDCAICADSPDPDLDPYVDGQDGVRASFDEWGNLIVDFGFRSVGFDFADERLPSGLYAGSYIATRLGGILQQMPVGTISCSEMNWVVWDATTGYTLLFQRDGAAPEADEAASAWALVKRVDDDTWTLEPRSCGGSGTDDLAAVVSAPNRGKVTYTFYGTLAMPFKLTLTPRALQ